MKVGDYVRTKHGIEIITDIKEWVHFQGYEKIITTDKNQYETLYEQNEIKKSSLNIIDILEKGDYVNGLKVIQMYSPEGKYTLWIKLSDNTFIDNSEDIKSIVTKEQFSCMEYKIGE